MGIWNSNSLSSTINRGAFYLEEEEIQKSEKSRKENPKVTSYEKKGFTTKEKASSNFSASSVNGKRTATHVLCHSTRSFRNKPLVALNWSSKSRKHHRCLLKCDQGKRIRGKILFWREYYFFEIVPTIYFNFNKYFVRIIFLFCFANFVGPKFTKFVRTIRSSNWSSFLEWEVDKKWFKKMIVAWIPREEKKGSWI